MINAKMPTLRFQINIQVQINVSMQLGLIADPVIEAIARLQFEDGLRTVVLPGGCWCPWGGHTYPRINTNPPGAQVGSRLGVVVRRSPLTDQISILPSSTHG